MNTLVTGGTGFIGSYVVRDLLLEGHNVVVYDLLPNFDVFERITPAEHRKKVEFERGDINDMACLFRVLKSYNIDKVVHLAGLLMQGCEDNPSLAIRVNCVGTDNLFAACTLLNIQRVVWASSIAVYGGPEVYDEDILSNDSNHKPHFFYGACKSFNEFVADYYARKESLSPVGLRFNVVYGPGKYSTGTRGSGAAFVSELIEKPVLSQELCSVPYGDGALDWLHVEDASKAVCLGLRSESRSGVYNICGEYRSFQDVASYVKSLLPEANIQLQPGEWVFCGKYDMSEAQDGIGYWPKYNMEEGVKQTINFLRREKGLPLVEA